MRAPIAGCAWRRSHSLASGRPALFRIRAGTWILPMSWSSAAHRSRSRSGSGSLSSPATRSVNARTRSLCPAGLPIVCRERGHEREDLARPPERAPDPRRAHAPHGCGVPAGGCCPRRAPSRSGTARGPGRRGRVGRAPRAAGSACRDARRSPWRPSTSRRDRGPTGPPRARRGIGTTPTNAYALAAPTAAGTSTETARSAKLSSGRGRQRRSSFRAFVVAVSPIAILRGWRYRSIAPDIG